MARIIKTEFIEPDTKLAPNDNDWVYNGLDCCVTLEVRHALKKLLDNTTNNTYQTTIALQAPILEMTARGIKIDTPKRDSVLRSIRQQLMVISAQLDAIIEDGIGLTINWRSPAQLKRLFYGILDLKPILKRTAQGIMSPTVNREALEQLQKYFIAEPLCLHLLALRDLDKKRGFLETAIDKDNRMRTNFNLAGTNTGRLSSSMSEFGTGTNLQNVDRDLRTVFVADTGMKFCNIDLEQGDARNVGAICWNLFHGTHGAAFAGTYLDACESGDLHTQVCRMAWRGLNWTDDAKANKVVAEQMAYRNDSYRQLAKKLGHGTNYYGTPPTMARHTKVDRKVIEEFQLKYFTAFPCIQSWHKAVARAIQTTGSLTTLLGRRRFFFGRPDDAATLREAIAYEPQSLTGDQINIAMLRLWRSGKVQLLLQVHDSLLFQFPEELEDTIVPWAIELSRVTIDLAGGRKFIIPTDAKVGWNWGEQQMKDGKVIGNADGLVKWAGHDSRQRQGKSSYNIRDHL